MIAGAGSLDPFWRRPCHAIRQLRKFFPYLCLVLEATELPIFLSSLGDTKNG